jgi:hypothetical protein
VSSEAIGEKKLRATQCPTIQPSNDLTILKDSIITGDILKKFLKPSTVVICPDDFTLYRLETELSLIDIFYLPGESTDTRKTQSWIDIKNHEYDIIV